MLDKLKSNFNKSHLVLTIPFIVILFILGGSHVLLNAPLDIYEELDDTVSFRYAGHIEKLSTSSNVEIQGIVTRKEIIHTEAYFMEFDFPMIEVNSSGKYYLFEVGEFEYDYYSEGDAIKITPSTGILSSVYRVGV